MRERGTIVIDPFNEDQLNPNSYNYRLDEAIKEYSGHANGRPKFIKHQISETGFILKPKQMYLANTLEELGSSTYAMSLIGRSSIGRRGLFLQISANLGHATSSHKWTLELVATKPIILYPKMIIGQISFWENKGDIKPYEGSYAQRNEPFESRLQHTIHDLNRKRNRKAGQRVQDNNHPL